MQLSEAILQALHTAWSHKLRSFFTLLGIIVSVAFLVAVVAVIQGMNAYVRERIGGGVVRGEPLPGRGPPPPVRAVRHQGRGAHPPPPLLPPGDAPFLRRGAPPPRARSLHTR